MINPEQAAELLQQSFETIEREQMAGLPLLNPMIRVETLGFQEYQGRVLGVVLTPWMMSLIMLPKAGDEWDSLELGSKQQHDFPSASYTFMVNEFEPLGRCLTYSLFSPMNEFANQDHALAAAQAFVDTLMVERDPNVPPPVDEALLGRIMRGEVEPDINLDDFATIEPVAATGPKCSRLNHSEGEGSGVTTVSLDKELSRRELLRGSFLRGS